MTLRLQIATHRDSRGNVLGQRIAISEHLLICVPPAKLFRRLRPQKFSGTVCGKCYEQIKQWRAPRVSSNPKVIEFLQCQCLCLAYDPDRHTAGETQPAEPRMLKLHSIRSSHKPCVEAMKTDVGINVLLVLA
jgi:hypothetical protein